MQRKLVEAEKYLKRALEEAKEGFGEDDPHVAGACNNLAELYRLKRDFPEAEVLYQEVCPTLLVPLALLLQLLILPHLTSLPKQPGVDKTHIREHKENSQANAAALYLFTVASPGSAAVIRVVMGCRV